MYLCDNALVLFPNPGYLNQVEAGTNPNSSIEDFKVDSKRITLSYVLREEPGRIPVPYGSIVIWLTRENTFFDLSGYDSLFLDIEKATAGKVVVFIKTFEKGVSKPEKEQAHTLRHNEYTLTVTPAESVYTINIKDFFTPDWWFNLMHVPWNKRGKETYTKVSALDFQFIHRDESPLKGKVEVFSVKKISFHKSYPVFYMILTIVAVLYCIFLVTVILTKGKGMTGTIRELYTPPLKEIRHRRLELENYADNELKRIMKYLEEHYSDPDISSSLISRETGIPRSHITELLKNQYGCSCKQIINRIRITEAQRLIKGTDRRILEIALEVGFNRCFKQIEGISPRQYRSGRH
jgi:AraC-like DNA-binding protein